MSLNSAEINLIISELDIKNSYIQKIVQPDFYSLLLSLYSPGERSNLFISLKTGMTRIHTFSGRIEKNEKLQRFAQFLRARISGGKITDISQPGNERIVKISVIKAGEITNLWIRLWGGNANIIAADENDIILDSYYRRPGKNEISGARFKYEIKRENQKNFEVREYQGGNFNDFIDSYYKELENKELLSLLHEQIKTLISRDISKYEARLSKIGDLVGQYENFEKYRQYGELIIAGNEKIKKGDLFFETENYYEENSTIRIPLEPKLSPEENSEKYFHKYKKAKSGLALLSEERESIKTKLISLRKRETILNQEKNIDILKKWISKQKALQSKSAEKEIPGLQFISGNFIIYAGRTAKENDELLRKYVRGNDYWLHTRDFPGGYIFIRSEKGKSIPLNTLLDAGNLALHFSKAKNVTRADIYYTQVKYLRRAKDGKKGLVIPTQTKNLYIAKDEKRLKTLLKN